MVVVGRCDLFFSLVVFQADFFQSACGLPAEFGKAGGGEEPFVVEVDFCAVVCEDGVAQAFKLSFYVLELRGAGFFVGCFYFG